MVGIRLLLMAGLFGAFAYPAVAGSSEVNTAQAVVNEAFDPDRIFKGEVEPSSEDEVILVALVGVHEQRLLDIPDYSLAIAYRCVMDKTKQERRCGYTARMLRASDKTEDRKWVEQLRSIEDASEVRSQLDRDGLQWLEADVEACPNGIRAMDSVRIADWNPDTHYALLPVKDRKIIIHPAMIRVRMKGSYATSTYEGWVGASGVPAAVRELAETLEPCWKPATAPRPWRRH